jgi:hypothetical protein
MADLCVVYTSVGYRPTAPCLPELSQRPPIRKMGAPLDSDTRPEANGVACFSRMMTRTMDQHSECGRG